MCFAQRQMYKGSLTVNVKQPTHKSSSGMFTLKPPSPSSITLRFILLWCKLDSTVYLLHVFQSQGTVVKSSFVWTNKFKDKRQQWATCRNVCFSFLGVWLLKTNFEKHFFSCIFPLIMSGDSIYTQHPVTPPLWGPWHKQWELSVKWSELKRMEKPDFRVRVFELVKL